MRLDVRSCSIRVVLSFSSRSILTSSGVGCSASSRLAGLTAFNSRASIAWRSAGDNSIARRGLAGAGVGFTYDFASAAGIGGGAGGADGVGCAQTIIAQGIRTANTADFISSPRSVHALCTACDAQIL